MWSVIRGARLEHESMRVTSHRSCYPWTQVDNRILYSHVLWAIQTPMGPCTTGCLDSVWWLTASIIEPTIPSTSQMGTANEFCLHCGFRRRMKHYSDINHTYTCVQRSRNSSDVKGYIPWCMWEHSIQVIDGKSSPAARLTRGRIDLVLILWLWFRPRIFELPVFYVRSELNTRTDMMIL